MKISTGALHQRYHRQEVYEEALCATLYQTLSICQERLHAILHIHPVILTKLLWLVTTGPEAILGV